MTSKPLVSVFAPDNPEHSTQVIAGLDGLEREGQIRLKYESGAAPPAIAVHGVTLRTSDGRVAVFDVSDSPQSYKASALDNSDYYFKRMCDPRCRPTASRALVLPFAPNYAVMSSRLSVLALRRAVAWKSALEAKRIVRALVGAPFTEYRSFRGVDSDISSAPSTANGKVLFLARAWDPDALSVRGDAEIREDRARINQERATLIRLLKQELGPHFTGGFALDEYSARYFPDVVVADERKTVRPAYLRTVREHSICIATRGLHGSVGWKFGEYLAMSRAVISEPPNCDFLIPITDGVNYLSFEGAESCVEKVMRLRDDPAHAERIIQANGELYARHLRPDRLMRTALSVAGILLRA